MTPAAHGRYCTACEKVVVDFTCMSDAELTGFLATRQSERVCGRFRAEQLSQPQVPSAPLANPTTWGLWLATVAIVLSSCETLPTLLGETNRKEDASTAEFFTVRGRVTDHFTHEPLAQAHITCLQDTTHQVYTEADGSFALLLPTRLSGSKLKITKDDGVYYATDLVVAAPKLDVSLTPQKLLVGDIAVLP